MRSVKGIRLAGVFLLGGLSFFLGANAQENSPFSRYGLGDLYPGQNIATRGMGGISAAYSNEQALNTINPASYSSLRFINVMGNSRGGMVSYDLGLTIDSRNLMRAKPAENFRSVNFVPAYITLGVPLSAKAAARKRDVGLVFGLRPYTKINYSVESLQKTPIDSIESLYEGSGGLNQVFVGLGKRWNNLSLGLNVGYDFGKKDISTKTIFHNDTVLYYKSDQNVNTAFWGLFINPGFTYNIKLNEVAGKNNSYKDVYFLKLGASATLKRSLDASMSTTVSTFNYDPNTGTFPIDTVYFNKDQKGNIDIPLTYTAGFMFSKKYAVGDLATATKWAFGADYTVGKWSEYRFYGQPDQVNDSWMIHAGTEFVPSLLSTNFWSRSTYRVGAYAGKDYINADGNGYNVKAVTLGFGFNVRRWTSYDNQSTFINTAFEFGKRGTDVNNISENFFKFSVGLSLADLWFTKQKYD